MRTYRLGFIIAVVAFLAITGCEKAKMAGTDMPEEAMKAEGAHSMPAMPAISAATIVAGDKAWTVEVATTPEARIKGLGGREGLAPNTGMWFVFEEDSTDPFWMKDTNFDLDMVFVDKDKKVVDVKKDNKALSEDLIEPAGAYRFVLEVPAGEAAGIQIGEVVEYRIGQQ